MGDDTADVQEPITASPPSPPESPPEADSAESPESPESAEPTAAASDRRETSPEADDGPTAAAAADGKDEAPAEDDPPDGPPWIAKMYAYDIATQTWLDRGAGAVEVRGTRLVLVDVRTNEVKFDAPLPPIGAYDLEHDSVVVWTDTSSATDFALSFQRPEGARALLDQPSPGALPMPSMSNVELLAQSVMAVVHKPPSARNPTIKAVLESRFLTALADVIESADDLDDTDTLEHLFRLVKSIVLLDPRQVCDRILEDDMYIPVFTALEHDPLIRAEVRYHHKTYLTEASQRVFVVELDESLRKQVDTAYRFAYLRDTAIPRWLDDTQMLAFAQGLAEYYGDILRRIADPSCADSVAVALRKAAEPGPDGKGCPGEPVRFLQQAFQMSRTCIDVRDVLFRAWVPRGLFEWIVAHLEHGSREAKDAALDVLYNACMHNVLPFRTYCSRHSNGLKVLVDLLLSDEPAVRSQVMDVLRMVLDGVSSAPEDQAVVEQWYSNHFERLVDALKVDKPETQQAVLDLLAFCVQHNAIAVHAFTRRTAVHVAAELLGSRHKLVILGVVRLFREMVRAGPTFHHFLLSKHNYLCKLSGLLQPARPATQSGDDIVVGAVLALIAGLCETGRPNGSVQQQFRELVKHLCEAKSDLEGKRHIFVIDKLFLAKLEIEREEIEEAREQDEKASAAPGAGNDGRNSPRRVNKMRDELREEAYFDDDDDEDEGPQPAEGETTPGDDSPLEPDAASASDADVQGKAPETSATDEVAAVDAKPDGTDGGADHPRKRIKTG